MAWARMDMDEVGGAVSGVRSDTGSSETKYGFPPGTEEDEGTTGDLLTQRRMRG